ncbi:response regulator [Verrucomicrobiaceae bacterium N1E253]|uniref:Response regulator n=1 Tax=Oceaniferula marina TaxID=2748318 RepID=A0A851GHF5_9BACT|nr:response regulator [Oceaniferula marina]NWK56312.1 response regulator [Oceaniferula marina]
MSEETYKDHVILFVDDEEKTRKYFARLFGHAFQILLAKDGAEALELFQEHLDEIGLVVTDQKMPNMTGSELLEKVAELKPLCVRILSTAYADIDAAVDSVNRGGIYRYVTKPWEVSDLEVTLRRAMEHYLLQKERDSMLRQKFSSVEMLASSDRVLSIASIAVFRNEELRRVGEALQVLVQLAEIGADEGDGRELIDDSLNWRELYRRHLVFLRSLRGGLTEQALSPGSLDYSSLVSVREVMNDLVGGESYFEWSGGETSTTGWPGSKEAMQAEIKLLMDAVESIMKDAGVLLVSEVQGGIELRLSSRLLAKNLESFRSATKEPPSSDCLALAAALFRLSHAGAYFQVVPEEKRGMVRLSVTFDPTKTVDSAQSGWDSLDAALSGNDVFWSQFGA